MPPRRATKPLVKLPNRNKLLQDGVDLPGYIWQEPPFKFDPQPFIPTHPDLLQKVVDVDVQIRSHSAWQNGMFRNGVYACASEPNDSKALYFAAHLVHDWTQREAKSKRVIWHSVKSTGFKNELLDNEETCDLLILSNLSPNASPPKLERVRDLLIHYSHIPRVVVIAGEDPISFFARRLYYKLNGLFFFSSKIVKRKAEVI